MNDQKNATTTTQQRPKPTPLIGLLILLTVAVMVGTFIFLNIRLGIMEFWPGLVFLFYWSTFEQFSLQRLPHTVIGMAAGIGLSCAVFTLPGMYGSAGQIAGPTLIAAAVYCLIMGWLTIVINVPAMLMLTVCTIPILGEAGRFAQIGLGLASGVIFFGTLAFVAQTIAGRIKLKPAAEAT